MESWPHHKISFIIVSFNTRQMTLDCLRSIYSSLETSNLSFEIIVVDNSSTDGSVAAIRSTFPDVRVIESNENLGFGKANNLAMKHANSDFFLLLNSDAFLMGNAIEELLSRLEATPRAAATAPRILNPDGSLQRSVWNYPSPARSWFDNSGLGPVLRKFKLKLKNDYYCWAHDEERMIDWAIGACLLIRREVFEQLGGFDEQFWMYAEETDWQKRWKDAGWQILFVPSACVTHIGGASGAGATNVKAAFFDSYDIYLRKHHGVVGVITARIAMIYGLLIRLPPAYVLSIVRPKNQKSKAKLKKMLALLKRHALTSIKR
jgi:GT2 family glycosyltransferase